jgi:hypothetical protein
MPAVKEVKPQTLGGNKQKKTSVISDFRPDVDDICAILGYYAE